MFCRTRNRTIRRDDAMVMKFPEAILTQAGPQLPAILGFYTL